MKKFTALCGVAVVGLGISLSAVAGRDAQVSGCGPDEASIDVAGMGRVTRDHLQEHLTKMEDQVKWAKRTEARTSQHRKALEQHLGEMQSALLQLDTDVAARHCVSDMSNDGRIQILEQRVDALQKIVEQLINHQGEAERP